MPRQAILTALGALLFVALQACIPATSFAAQATDSYRAEYELYRRAIKQRDLSQAMRHSRRALEIARREIEPGDPILGILAFNLGSVYHQRKRYSDAVSVLEEAVVYYEAAHGRGASETLTPIKKLARCHQLLGHWPEAEKHYASAITLIEQARGRNDEEIADILAELVHVAEALKQPKRVRSYGLRALLIYQRTREDRDPKIGWIHVEVARAEMALSDFPAAEKHIAVAVQILEAALPPADPQLIKLYAFLANSYERAGKQNAARKYRRKRSAAEKAATRSESE